MSDLKHRELIQAALDGKVIQFRRKTAAAKNGSWADFRGARLAIANLASEYPSFEYRIKPEPVPDVVMYSTMYPWEPTDVENWKVLAIQRGSVPVKLTIKTDADGVKTKTVEILDV